MANEIKNCIPAITVRAGKVRKPNITLGEVLNFIERANQRQSRIILNTMRHTAWYVPNQVDYAFDGGDALYDFYWDVKDLEEHVLERAQYAALGVQISKDGRVTV